MTLFSSLFEWTGQVWRLHKGLRICGHFGKGFVGCAHRRTSSRSVLCCSASQEEYGGFWSWKQKGIAKVSNHYAAM